MKSEGARMPTPESRVTSPEPEVIDKDYYNAKPAQEYLTAQRNLLDAEERMIRGEIDDTEVWLFRDHVLSTFRMLQYHWKKLDEKEKKGK